MNDKTLKKDKTVLKYGFACKMKDLTNRIKEEIEKERGETSVKIS